MVRARAARLNRGMRGTLAGREKPAPTAQDDVGPSRAKAGMPPRARRAASSRGANQGIAMPRATAAWDTGNCGIGGCADAVGKDLGASSMGTKGLFNRWA